LHIVISFLTHADHVFLGLPQFLVPGTPNRMMELMHEVALSAKRLFRSNEQLATEKLYSFSSKSVNPFQPNTASMCS